MKASLKPLPQQVIVITGASSGIGLATAQLAASQGATVVLAARSRQALERIAADLRQRGEIHAGEVMALACDVSDREQVEHVAHAAVERFGRIDTWVNNAGVSIYGRLDEVTDEDSRRLFDVNFWGVVYGSLAALPHLRRAGGALINVGSEVSEAYVPMLGMYTATKHAVKGFTDSLRVETEQLDDAPVSITLIQPTAVDTPFPMHARNYQATEASLPSPTIEPRKVAEAILDAAVNPARAKKVGMMATINTAAARITPALADRMSAKASEQLHTHHPARDRMGALHRPSEATTVVGRTHGEQPAEKT